jgi:hypothetical protein
MKRMICLFFVLGFLANAVALADTEKKPAVDFTDPVKVVQAIFDAAKNKDIVILTTLCDPEGENDGDTRRICDVAKDTRKLDEFVLWFSKGKVTGEAVIEEDRARVPFIFGPDGNKKEEMNLIKRDGKWYLYSF